MRANGAMSVIATAVWLIFTVVASAGTAAAAGQEMFTPALPIQARAHPPAAPEAGTRRRGTPPPIVILESSLTRLVIQVSLPELLFHPSVGPDGRRYTGLEVIDSGIFEPTAPNVPVFGFWILIPNGTEAQLQVESGAPEVFTDLLVPPVQRPWPDLDGEPPPPFERNEEVYATDADYPGTWARLEPVRLLRGQQWTLLWLYPYQHNPVRRTLSVHSGLRITVEFQGQPIPLQDAYRSKAYDAIMEGLTLNADAVLGTWEPMPVGSYGWDYVILLQDSQFLTAANTLAAWKTKLGFKTYVELLPSTWKAGDIQSALASAYDTWTIKPRYLLIIGDANKFPCDYQTLHPYQSSPTRQFTQGKTGTDWYYSTPSGIADPAFAIGRLSVETAREAEDRVRGIINYEKSPPTASSFYNTATIAAYFEDQYWNQYFTPDTIEDRRFTQTSEDLAIFLSSSIYGINKAVNRIYYAESTVNPLKWNDNQYLSLGNFGGGPAGSPGASIPNYLKRPTFLWDGDRFDIANAINAGTFLLTHRDHGARDKWGKPLFDWQDVFLLANNGLLPVVWSLNCQTGWFDNETDFPGMTDQTGSGDDSFSEWWESPYWQPSYDVGAVGILAPTRVTVTIYNDRLMWGWTDAIWPDFITNYPGIAVSLLSMGDVMNFGKLYMQTKIYGSSTKPWVKAHLEEYHWFGDPAMGIRTDKPPLVVAVSPAVWSNVLHPDDLIAHVEWHDSETRASGPLEGATVTITRPGSSLGLWRATTDEAGDALFPGLLLAETGDYDLVASASNTVPHIGSFTAQVGPAGGILLAAPLTSCAAPIEIRLGDAHLSGAGSYRLPASTSGGDSELATLQETGAATGYFVGMIWTASGPPLPGDGVLQVSDGETVTVEYQDTDDGSGQPNLVQVSALVDCQPPTFAGLRSATFEDDRVLLEWDAAVDEHGPVSYAIYRSDPTGRRNSEPIATTTSLSYPDYEIVPGTTYAYVVRARDAVGNEDSNNTAIVVSVLARLVTGSASGGSSMLRRFQRD